jgi:hypothetical protein
MDTFDDVKVEGEVTDPWKGEHGKALVVFSHGKPAVLTYGGPRWLVDYVSNEWGAPAEYVADRWADYEAPPDGVYIAELAMVDDGPSDWNDGSRESIETLRKFRPVTAREWSVFLDGDWPWGEDGSELS